MAPPAIDLVALAKGTFKRLAWAYGCSKVGSAGEAVLERMLRDRVMTEAGAARDADVARECTGLTARWCPRCGDCCCVGDDMDNPSCPLHAPASMHSEAVDPNTAPR